MMEARKDYGVRVIRAYGEYSVGQILYPFGMMRSHLLDSGFVEKVLPPVDESKKKPRAREQ